MENSPSNPTPQFPGPVAGSYYEIVDAQPESAVADVDGLPVVAGSRRNDPAKVLAAIIEVLVTNGLCRDETTG